jgi:transposase
VYVEDETELALLPTLTRCWMRQGHQRKIPAPGTNRKRHLFAATDWRDGTTLRRYADRRDSATFCVLCDALVWRSRGRRRKALVLVDNAHIHRPEKSRQVAALLQRHGRWLELVYLPAYSPELQPLDHLFRVLRGRVTHNHHRRSLAMLEADAEGWFHALARHPHRTLRIIGSAFAQEGRRHAA